MAGGWMKECLDRRGNRGIDSTVSLASKMAV